MIKRGSLDWSLDSHLIDVDWECEISSYGDESRDIDFEAWSYNKKGKAIPLKESLQDDIYEKLVNDGEI